LSSIPKLLQTNLFKNTDYFLGFVHDAACSSSISTAEEDGELQHPGRQKQPKASSPEAVITVKTSVSKHLS